MVRIGRNDMNCLFCKKPIKHNAKAVTLLTGRVLHGEYLTYEDGVTNSITVCENDFNLSLELLISIFNKLK